jgi:transposase-like protein
LAHEEVEHAASRLQRRFLRKARVILRVSKETISRITDKVIEELDDWAVRPLEFPIARLYYTKTTGLWTRADPIFCG